MKRKSKHKLDSYKGDWTVAELSINYHPAEVKPHSIQSANDAYQLIKKLWDKEKLMLQEQFMALYFNRANQLLGYKLISAGTMSQCLVDIKLLVGLALVSPCEQVIVAHNHPSVRKFKGEF